MVRTKGQWTRTDISTAVLVERYENGTTSGQLAREFGVTKTMIKQRLKHAGVELRPSTWRPELSAPVVAAYRSGTTIKELCETYDLDPHTISRELRKLGLTVRPRSSYAANTAAANVAARTRQQTYEERVKRALSNERSQTHISKHEQRFASFLDDLGLSYIQQRAIGTYNVDFALISHPVAIEIRGGSGNARVDKQRSHRRAFLLGVGWSLFEVLLGYRNASKAGLLTAESARCVLPLLDELNADPTKTPRHWLVYGDGEAYIGNAPSLLSEP